MARINIPIDSQRCSCTKVSSWLTQRKSWHVLLPSFVEDTLVLIHPVNHCKWCFVARLLHWISRQPLATLRCAATENTRLAQKQLLNYPSPVNLLRTLDSQGPPYNISITIHMEYTVSHCTLLICYIALYHGCNQIQLGFVWKWGTPAFWWFKTSDFSCSIATYWGQIHAFQKHPVHIAGYTSHQWPRYIPICMI